MQCMFVCVRYPPKPHPFSFISAYADGKEADLSSVRIYTDAEGAHKAVKETT